MVGSTTIEPSYCYGVMYRSLAWGGGGGVRRPMITTCFKKIAATLTAVDCHIVKTLSYPAANLKKNA